MKILISNDDGIESPGIQALAKAAGKLGEVFVVAPDRERSTSGHSLTLHKPVRISRVRDHQYSTSGSPADCIYLGVREVMKEAPDLILSGINSGANLGTDVHYSGTVAAAREGALMNIPSYAFSIVDIPQMSPKVQVRRACNFEEIAKIAVRTLEKTLKVTFPPHTLLNVNIANLPIDQIRGVRVTRQGFRYYSLEVTKRQDPRGRDYYWIGGSYIGFEKSDVSDCHAVEEGFVAITPITIDCTDQDLHDLLIAAKLNEMAFE